MWLSLILVVLILAIAFLQATHGLFSALIMAVLTICCAAAAIGTYEWVAVHWIVPYWKPDYAFPVALAATFGIPLIILRLVTDKLVRRAGLIPVWIDRIGGAFCGFITAMMIVGVFALVLEQIPFGTSVLTFARVNVPAREKTEDGPDPVPPKLDAPESELWLTPDRFAVATVSILSAGIFSGSQSLGYVNPDMVQALGWVNAVHPEVSRYAAADSASVVRAETIPYVYRFVPGSRRPQTSDTYEPAPNHPKPGHVLLMVRLRLGPGARDERRSLVFTPRQIRLVGRREGQNTYEQYHAIAIQQADASQSRNRHIISEKTRWGDWPVVDKIFQPRDDHREEIEVVFEIPADLTPKYVEYKRGAKAPVILGGGERSQSTDRRSPTETSSRRRTSAQRGEAEDNDQDTRRESSGRRSRRRSRAEDTSTTQRAERSASDDTKTESPEGETARADEGEPAQPSRSRRSRRRARRTGDEETVPDSGRGGRVRGVTTRSGQSRFSDELPLVMTSYQQVRGLNANGEALTDGQIWGEVARQDGGTDRPLKRFDVPDDKRMLQLNTSRLHARSGLGQALEFAASTVQNYFVEDANGKRYKIQGKYAIANVNGTQTIEIQYFLNQAGTIGGVGKFTKIKDSDLEGDYELVILFLVDPGVEIVSFSTGGAATRGDDLRGEGLVAPE